MVLLSDAQSIDNLCWNMAESEMQLGNYEKACSLFIKADSIRSMFILVIICIISIRRICIRWNIT